MTPLQNQSTKHTHADVTGNFTGLCGVTKFNNEPFILVYSNDNKLPGSIDCPKCIKLFKLNKRNRIPSLVNQSNKAKHIQTTICLTNGCQHKHVTACRSLTSPELNYQQTIIPTGKTEIDGHKIITYSVKCEQILATGLVACKGNGHCHTLCQHSLSGVRAVVKAQGKTLRTAKTLANALKSAGILIKLVGESGFCYGVINND